MTFRGCKTETDFDLVGTAQLIAMTYPTASVHKIANAAWHCGYSLIRLTLRAPSSLLTAQQIGAGRSHFASIDMSWRCAGTRPTKKVLCGGLDSGSMRS